MGYYNSPEYFTIKNLLRLLLSGFTIFALVRCGGGDATTPAPGNLSEQSGPLPPPVCVVGATGFDGGTGTPIAPYLIGQVSQLNNIGCNVASYFRLTSDLDLSVVPSFYPIYFQGGGFDGGGHTISNLTQNSSSSLVGFFASISNATVQNLTLANIQLSNSSIQGSGGLSNTAKNATVTNCHVSGSISGNAYAGGVIGYSDSSSLDYVSFDGTLSGGSQVGGIVGYLYNSALSHSSTNANITGSMYAGGAVGMMTGSNTSTSSARGSVYASMDFAGGIVGKMVLVSSLANVYSLSITSSHGSAGGLVGGAEGATISNSYAAGLVSAAGSSGGLIANTQSANSVTSSYWDSQTTGQSNTVGGGTSQTTSNMQNQSTFSGWDFSGIWRMDPSSYPQLR